MSRSHGKQTGDLAHSSDGTSCDSGIAIVIFCMDFSDEVLLSSSVTNQPVAKAERDWKLPLEYHMLTGALVDQPYYDDNVRETE